MKEPVMIREDCRFYKPTNYKALTERVCKDCKFFKPKETSEQKEVS